MKEFVLTFAIKYVDEPHPVFEEATPYGYITILADSEAAAKKLVTKRTGDVGTFLLDVTEPDGEEHPKWCLPRGEVGRWKA